MAPGDVVDGRFLLERLAGKGGMGAVYEARDTATHERVAVKILRPTKDATTERFAREAQVLAELEHPYIVRYLAHGTLPSGDTFLVMEWLEGLDLLQRVKQRGLDMAETLAVIQRVAEALAFAHARGVVHRDVKPSNVMLLDGDPRRVKLLDFGIARITSEDALELTGTGMILGTPGYMAPEQARSSRTIDARADVYALGCVFFRLLTRRPPFVGRDPTAVLAKIALEEAPRVSELVPEVPPELDDLVAGMLAHRPEDRPADGAAVARALAALGAITMLDRPSALPEGLTTGEKRLVAVVLAPSAASGGQWERSGNDGAPTTQRRRISAPDAALLPDDATLQQRSGARRALEDHDRQLAARLRKAALAHDANVVFLADGSAAALLSGSGSATDLARRAARCALAFSAASDGSPVALSTGRAEMSGRLPVGEAIDRAVSLLERRGSGAHARAGEHERTVWLDDVTAALLGDRFDVRGARDELTLAGELRAPAGVRQLLGRATPFVGRERELLTLEATYEECVAEPVARVVIVTGAPGDGKSRLRHELLQKLAARAEPPTVLVARGDPMGAGSAFAMLGQALTQLVGLDASAPVDARRAQLVVRVAQSLSPGADAATPAATRVAHFVGPLVGLPFDDDASVQLRAARQDPMLMGDQIRRASEELLSAEGARRPIVLVLEDLQWGDLSSVQFVDTALRNLRDRPLLVLAIARPEVHTVFPALFGAHAVTTLKLGPLSRKASERLARAVLGDGAAAATIERAVTHAGGNAFYLEELLRGIAEHGGEELPETVLAMVQSRIEALEGDARRVLRAASVFGPAFWSDGVAHLLGPEAAGSLADWLVELARREWITERPQSRFAGTAEYTFRQATLREAGYAMLTEADRALGHRLAGEWLEKNGERDALTLAEHFRLGGDGARAVRAYAEAARQALEGNDLAAVIRLADAAAATGASGEALGELRLLQAEAHRWRGENKEAGARGHDAQALLRPGTIGWYRALGEVAMACGRTGDVDGLVATGGLLLAVPAADGADPARRIAAARAVIQLFHSGRPEHGQHVLAAAELDLDALRATQPLTAAWVDTARLGRALADGDPGTAWQCAQRAVEECERAGDLRTACMQRINVGFVAMEVGALAEAEQTLRDAVVATARLGLRDALAIAQSNLGLVLTHLGRLADAKRVERTAIESLAAQGNRLMEGCSRNYLAIALFAGGELDAAEREARAAIDVTAKSPAARAYALATLARVLVATGRASEAVTAAHDANALVADTATAEEGDAAVRLCLAEALRASGDEAGARAVLATAVDRLFERAARIKDTSLRDKFLAGPPDHRLTLALAKR